jgi:signal peptidase I
LNIDCQSGYFVVFSLLSVMIIKDFGALKENRAYIINVKGVMPLMEGKKQESAALSWLKQIILIILITIAVSVLIIQTYDINDISMEPTFDRQGNRVLVFLTPYLFKATPNYGDIVIIDSRVERSRSLVDRLVESPLPALLSRETRDYMWVKRVVGLPGDRLEFIMGRVYRNGEVLDEDYIKGKMTMEHEPVVVPEGYIFVLGDNRNHSSDSRQIGPVPLENIQGRVILRFLPFTKINVY